MTVITLSYAGALSFGWPQVKFAVAGDGSDYSKITVLQGSPDKPSQAELDAWMKSRLKSQLWEAIKEKRDRVSCGGVLISSYWFHSDADSLIKYLGLVGMGAGMPAGIKWKTMNGEFVEMSPALAVQILQAVSVLDITAFAVAQAHKTSMELAVVPQAYDYSTGWPATFNKT